MTKEFYEKYWAKNDAPPTQDPLTPKRINIFLGEVKKYPAVKNILDIGCGEGRVAGELQNAGFNVTGIDISQTAVNRAKKNFQDIEFLVASPETGLPFDDGRFDAIYCTEVIEHIYDVESAVKEMARILKENGLLFISTPYHGFFKNLIISLFGFERHFQPTGSHIRFFTRKSLSDLLVNNNFQIAKAVFFGRFWPLWMDMAIVSKLNISSGI